MQFPASEINCNQNEEKGKIKKPSTKTLQDFQSVHKEAGCFSVTSSEKLIELSQKFKSSNSHITFPPLLF